MAGAGQLDAGTQLATPQDSYKYVGFEDRFRGAPVDIRAGFADYARHFEGASDVLDAGCGRGEFLEILRETGVTASGVDVNPEMVAQCRERGLDVTEGDLLAHLAVLPDASLGGLFAAQVVEHLEPAYLLKFIDTAFLKLRPGARIVLETINVASWTAFFQSYVRDITHVRPLHPDTLAYLVTAGGFQQVEVVYCSPIPPEHRPRAGARAGGRRRDAGQDDGGLQPQRRRAQPPAVRGPGLRGGRAAGLTTRRVIPPRAMEQVDVAIVGGGVVGLAAACAVAERDRSTCVLERRPRTGMESSTHNSGVIHAGIYYPRGSLKARLCVEGREMLYRFCARHDVPYARCGKLIAASSPAEIPELEALARRGRANGAGDLDVVDRGFIRRREPAIAAPAALWSPLTGIVEAEALVRTLAAMARDREAYLLPGTAVIGGTAHPGGIELETPRERISARTVVNAAGLHADELSAMLGGEEFTIHPVRGEYAELGPRVQGLINGLVYPLPERSGHGLGVHFTKTTRGTVTVGPTRALSGGPRTTTRERACHSSASTNPHAACCPPSPWTTSDWAAAAFARGPVRPTRRSPTSSSAATGGCRRSSMPPASTLPG